MSTIATCPKCGGGLRTQQIEGRKTNYCDHCGALPYRDGLPETGRGHLSQSLTYKSETVE